MSGMKEQVGKHDDEKDEEDDDDARAGGEAGCLHLLLGEGQRC